jgi:signal transduction histidine kinase
MYFPRKNIRSILQNLISNAIKYRSPDRDPIIKIRTEKINDYILLQISDNGMGIKEEDKFKVLEMYHRLHGNIEGTGVGLGIVGKIVNNNGGKIEIESELGKGSTFRIYLKV